VNFKNYHDGKIDFIPRKLPLMVRFKMLFKSSLYGFDRQGDLVTFVRSKEVNNTLYVLERGEFDVNNFEAWAFMRGLCMRDIWP
jgi:hypothetical protein